MNGRYTSATTVKLPNAVSAMAWKTEEITSFEEISDGEFIEILERTSSGNPYGEGLLKAIKQNSTK